MSLTLYQQAILQEMGITVWVNKVNREKQRSDSTAKKTTNGAIPQQGNGFAHTKPITQPITQEEKQSKVAQLRAQMGSSTKAETDPEKVEEKVLTATLANEQPYNTPRKPKNVPLSPEGVPLSAQQREEAKVWLVDLQLACVQLGLSSTLVNSVMISNTLSVKENAIILPAAPRKLDKAQKRALWHALIDFAHTG